jgi:hypothetical protein
MVLVRIAMLLVALATGVATLLGNLADQLPDDGATIPAVCVPAGPVQAGYCP